MKGLMGSNESTAQPIVPAPAPVAPPNPNPTVQTGDNQLAQDNAAAQAQQKGAASTVLTTPSAVTASADVAGKKTILGG